MAQPARTAARSRPAPPCSGAHKIQGNYSPTIDFTLAQGQDFMAPMNLAEGGDAPSGAEPGPLERGAGRDRLCAGAVRRQ